ncbi:MAG: hypothetical protein HYW37_00860 [Candidatus Colwellbacteria bacterium]|nr:hypothetical protein [Candidatus Colwellbacteria bacterium]
MTEVATRRPFHEVILEAIGANAGAVEKLGSDFLIRAPFCAAEAVMMLCKVVQETTFPEKHLAEMIAELQRIKEADASTTLGTFLDEAIRDLEARQAEAHQLERVTTEGEHV